MATLTVKSTYSLDPATVRALETMAARWGVSKSEALRRAIAMAAQKGKSGELDALGVLSALQRTAGLSPAKARTWAARARSERRASSVRREWRG